MSRQDKKAAPNLEQALENCLARFETGQASLEECLADYPGQAAELRPLLLAAKRVRQGQTLRPSGRLKARTRSQLLAHMEAHPHRRSIGWNIFAWFQLSPVLRRTVNVALSIAAILLLFMTTGTVLAQQALPGQPLYGWKIASEQVLQTIYPDSLTVDIMVAERRTNDLTQVASTPEAKEVALENYAESLSDLSEYTEPHARRFISESLVEQKTDLEEAEVAVPELEKLLAVVKEESSPLQIDHQVIASEAGRIHYRITLTAQGPASPVAATLVSRLSPQERIDSITGQASCRTSTDALSCTVANLRLEAPRQLNLTTTVNPCYSGPITNTVTLTNPVPGVDLNSASSNSQAVATSWVEAPFPHQTQIAYVQSDEQSHYLGLVSASGQPINYRLHSRAAAPAWSPDGSTLAFFGEEGISELGGIYSQGNGLWLMDIVEGEGHNIRQLVAQDHIKSIAWSPDGSQLAFELGPPGLPHDVLIVDAQEGTIISRFRGEQPAWHPNGRQLAIKACLPGCGLWQVKMDGTQPRRLTFDSSDSHPDWSSSGRYLAFASQDRDDDWEIYLRHMTDGQLTRLTARDGTDTTPIFGPCDQEIYLRTDHYGGWRITVMKTDGSNEQLVQEGVGASKDWSLARPAVN